MTFKILLGMEEEEKLKEKDKQSCDMDLRSAQRVLFAPIKMRDTRRHTQQY